MESGAAKWHAVLSLSSSCFLLPPAFCQPHSDIKAKSRRQVIYQRQYVNVCYCYKSVCQDTLECILLHHTRQPFSFTSRRMVRMQA